MFPHLGAEELLDVEVDKLELIPDYNIFFSIEVDCRLFLADLFAFVPVGCFKPLLVNCLVDVAVERFLEFFGKNLFNCSAGVIAHKFFNLAGRRGFIAEVEEFVYGALFINNALKD